MQLWFCNCVFYYIDIKKWIVKESVVCAVGSVACNAKKQLCGLFASEVAVTLP